MQNHSLPGEVDSDFISTAETKSLTGFANRPTAKILFEKYETGQLED